MIKIGIIGATGYTGRELIRLLLRHREAEILHLSAIVDKEVPISSIFPALSCDIMVKSTMNLGDSAECDVIFLCLPHRVSMEYAPSLLDIGKRVVDLSADFRLKDVGIYEEWYNTRHTASLLIDEAVYGLCELYRDKIREAKLIANPGCYPTSVILGLAPLLREGLIEEGSIIIDAKSGVSGAGRSPSELTHFPEANESIRAYSVFSHRHKPEIEQELSALAGSDIKVCFVPHLAPMSNGILTTIYAKLKREESLLNLYKQFYQGEPFVKILKEPPSVKDAVGTNLCLIHPASEKDRVVVLSCIDNLIKGASGQAVQNMNIMFGMDEIDGLI